jgi:hypothetical protein
MNAVPDSGPVKTIQLKDKIIAITGANRGQRHSLSHKFLELTALRHRTGNSRLLSRQRRLQNLLHRHRHPRRRLRRHLHQVPRPALRRPSRCNQGRIDPSRRRQDSGRSRRAARNGPSPLPLCPSLLEMAMHKPPDRMADFKLGSKRRPHQAQARARIHNRRNRPALGRESIRLLLHSALRRARIHKARRQGLHRLHCLHGLASSQQSTSPPSNTPLHSPTNNS